VSITIIPYLALQRVGLGFRAWGKGVLDPQNVSRETFCRAAPVRAVTGFASARSFRCENGDILTGYRIYITIKKYGWKYSPY